MTYLLIKTNDNWIVFQHTQADNLSLQTSDIQDYKVVHEFNPPSDVTLPLCSEDFSQPFCISTQWPSLGQEYYFIVMTNPFDITIQKSVITEDILQKYNETNSGNMFESYEGAASFARSISDTLYLNTEGGGDQNGKNPHKIHPT